MHPTRVGGIARWRIAVVVLVGTLVVTACSETRGDAQALAGGGPIQATAAPAARGDQLTWWVYPNLVERRGPSFDTSLTFALAAGARERRAIRLHLFHEDGSPVTSCAPCVYELDPKASTVNVKLEPLVSPPGSGLWLGFGLVGVPGAADEVVSHGASRNDNGDRRDDTLFTPQPQIRSFVLPHVLENAFGNGPRLDIEHTFDTSVFVTYTPGLAGIPTGPGATVDLFLMDPAGKPAADDTGEVCDPCRHEVGPRKRTVRVDVNNLLSAAQTQQPGVKFGFAMLVVGGQDPDGVNIQGFVVNAANSAHDLAVFGFDPQPIAAAP